ncbi:hypothetical protein [Halomicrobium urmianum]|uniref:hypothetical protein n=1 Tax=Halomicrobium urmianum TaxID=1586233 RepID=UPI001CDA1BEA|nr:hypothetical protein [Halomicrobium urmianum]
MADERVVSVKLEQIEQYHGELKEKQEALARDEFLANTTETRSRADVRERDPGVF